MHIHSGLTDHGFEQQIFDAVNLKKSRHFYNYIPLDMCSCTNMYVCHAFKGTSSMLPQKTNHSVYMSVYVCMCAVLWYVNTYPRDHCSRFPVFQHTGTCTGIHIGIHCSFSLLPPPFPPSSPPSFPPSRPPSLPPSLRPSSP